MCAHTHVHAQPGSASDGSDPWRGGGGVSLVIVEQSCDPQGPLWCPATLVMWRRVGHAALGEAEKAVLSLSQHLPLSLVVHFDF